MTALEQLLLGFSLISFGLMLAFAWLWWREIDRRIDIEVSRDNLRAILKDAAHQRDRVRQVA
jgi:hypothetical protein